MPILGRPTPGVDCICERQTRHAATHAASGHACTTAVWHGGIQAAARNRPERPDAATTRHPAQARRMSLAWKVPCPATRRNSAPSPSRSSALGHALTVSARTRRRSRAPVCRQRYSPTQAVEERAAPLGPRIAALCPSHVRAPQGMLRQLQARACCGRPVARRLPASVRPDHAALQTPGLRVAAPRRSPVQASPGMLQLQG
ncbi:hypothetical protein FHY19_003341 [Xanthomonas arboricola]|nr:hypothetical protein [Xanthomonas sp. 4461]